ncbi:MAG TPA: transaldolase family protein [Candidatus Saccharimonadales bacterium]|nr:transaldolase family protein [Candidatus Saccharimonadales bacterium]
MAKFLLDSGDVNEYREIAKLAQEKGSELWGATTNPSLIAKKLAGKKITQEEAFRLQKEIVKEILTIVPGAVSAEVYADKDTTAEEMIEQGREIATWDARIFVKLPTTVEGFKARTALRKDEIMINNTLVFSLQQIFAIFLHEKIVRIEYEIDEEACFISPFVGRLDDKGKDGMMVIEQAVEMKKKYNFSCWVLESSVRNPSHIKRGIDAGTDIMTVPAAVLREWLMMSNEEKESLDATDYAKNLAPMPNWQPLEELLGIKDIEQFMSAIETKKLDVSDALTTAGIDKFAADWKSIIV